MKTGTVAPAELVLGASTARRSVRFGAHRFDAARGSLLHGDREVHLAAKTYQVLLVFLERPGELISKEELFSRLWPDTLVEENNLSQQIAALRRALAEGDPDTPYVETVPRRGYRFAAPVVPVGDDGGSVPGPPAFDRAPEAPRDASTEPIPPTGEAPSRRLSLGAWAGALAIAGVAATLLAGSWYARASATSEADPLAGVRSIAVLPLRALDEQPGGASLGVGLADALITRFGQEDDGRELAVRPTAAVLRFEGGAADPHAAARELRVDAVLDGSFQRAAGRTRVSLQLVGRRDGETLWSTRFEVDGVEPFTIEDALAEHVAARLSGGLARARGPRAWKRREVDPEAYAAYLEGRYHWNRRTPEELADAARLFERSISIDPTFARGYAGLADAYNLVGDHRRGEAAARRALELDPELAEAHAALGNVWLFHSWNATEAERELRRAIALHPSYATAHHWLAYVHLSQGRFAPAIESIERARELDPLSLILQVDYGQILHFAGRTDEGLREIQEALRLDPTFAAAYQQVAQLHLSRGRFVDALRATTIWRRLGGRAETTSGARAAGDNHARLPEDEAERDAALELLASARAQHARGERAACHALSQLASLLGDPETALVELGHLVDAREGVAILFGVDPLFRPLRDTPEFGALLGRIWGNGPTSSGPPPAAIPAQTETVDLE